ncbi:type I-E CRISPR-associated protein Cse2/CasB [Plastorhodobacter daqingensis]|uniref:Type I-E CRISPR-associated protein Cse2/CasB n=1 Tax=Plastorhodobacter daqingensis TaxID=1387281 RepID=A0ABW2UNE2_9RHOB
MLKPENETARRALAITAALAAADPGEKAEARRMGPAGSALFWRQTARLGIGRDHEEAWRQFTRLVALMTPASRDTSVHSDKHPLGAALAEAGLSEQRFARLLAARGPARADALERAIRMMARKVERLDVIDLARAILWPADTSRLARSYYQHLDHSTLKEHQDG